MDDDGELKKLLATIVQKDGGGYHQEEMAYQEDTLRDYSKFVRDQNKDMSHRVETTKKTPKAKYDVLKEENDELLACYKKIYREVNEELGDSGDKSRRKANDPLWQSLVDKHLSICLQAHANPMCERVIKDIGRQLTLGTSPSVIVPTVVNYFTDFDYDGLRTDLPKETGDIQCQVKGLRHLATTTTNRQR